MKGQFPWIGRSRGSAGGMTTAKVNDKNVMKATAYEVTNPKTAAQVMQRDFFKQVQEVCASVTEDQLRSLFGVKPKTMTRRNALSKQIAAAYTITDGVKSVDFSKLLAIGNGEKINVPIVPITEGIGDYEITWPASVYTKSQGLNTILIAVVFDVTNSKIIVSQIIRDNMDFDDRFDGDVLSDVITGDGFGYVTEATIPFEEEQPFGTFKIKTRATN